MKIIKFIARKGVYVLVTLLLMLATAILVTSLENKLTTSYPPIHILQNTNKLICEKEIESSIGASDNCNAKYSYGWVRAGAEQMSEASRIGQTEEWISKDSFQKRKIKYRTENNTIYIKDVMLIQEMEDEQTEEQFTIKSDDGKYLTASLLSNTNLATSSATLFLDKSKGLLIINTTSTSVFCAESVASTSTLYSCQEN